MGGGGDGAALADDGGSGGALEDADAEADWSGGGSGLSATMAGAAARAMLPVASRVPCGVPIRATCGSLDAAADAAETTRAPGVSERLAVSMETDAGAAAAAARVPTVGSRSAVDEAALALAGI